MNKKISDTVDSKLDTLRQEHQFISPGIRAILDGIKNREQVDEKLIDLLENDSYQFSTNLSLIAEFKDTIFGGISADTTIAIFRILQRKYREDKEGTNKAQILELVLQITRYTAGSSNAEEAGKILNWFSVENKESKVVIERIREALKAVDPSFVPPPPMASSKTAS